MAKKLSASSKPIEGDAPAAEPNPQHNMAARKDLIIKAKQELGQLDKQILPKMEEVKALRKQKSDIYRNLKNDLDMDRDDAELAFRMVDLEPENRSKFADTIREIFSACGVGEQIDFLGALEQDGAAGGNPEPGTIADDGYQAGLHGKDAAANPHTKNSDAHATWHNGWLKGQAAAVNASLGAKANGKAKTEVTAH